MIEQHNFADIVSALLHINIKLLAVDFDLTLIDTHTRGDWVGPAQALVSRGRPYLKQLVEEALRRGLYVSIVTFSPQVSLISQVVLSMFPLDGHKVLLFEVAMANGLIVVLVLWAV